MTRVHRWILAVLLLQCLLVALLWWNNQRSQQTIQIEALLPLDVAAISRILVEGSSQQVSLQRSEGQHWMLPELYDLPADQQRINAALKNVQEMKTYWPVATQGSGRERFEVAEENFQRRITLYAGEETVAAFYLGTSPGFRQSHVRLTDKDEIYVQEVNSFDWGEDARFWLDKTLLATAEAVSIQGQDYLLRKEGGNWSLSDSGDETVSEQRIGDLVAALENLRVLGVSDTDFSASEEVADEKKEETEEVAEVDGEGNVALPATATLTINSADQSWKYHFAHLGDEYAVQREDISHWFTLTRDNYAKIAAITRTQLLAVEEDTAIMEEENLPAAEEADDMPLIFPLE